LRKQIEFNKQSRQFDNALRANERVQFKERAIQEHLQEQHLERNTKHFKSSQNLHALRMQQEEKQDHFVNQLSHSKSSSEIQNNNNNVSSPNSDKYIMIPSKWDKNGFKEIKESEYLMSKNKNSVKNLHDFQGHISYGGETNIITPVKEHSGKTSKKNENGYK